MNKELFHHLTPIFLILLLSIYCCYTSPVTSVDQNQHHEESSSLSAENHEQPKIEDSTESNKKLICIIYGICNDDNDHYNHHASVPGYNEEKSKRLSSGLFHGIPKFGRRAFSSAFSGIPKFG